MLEKKQNFWIHILGSIGFLFLAFLFSPDWPDVPRMFRHPFGISDVVFQLEMLLLFYLNYYFFIDKFYFPKRYLVYAGIMLAFFVGFLLIDNLIFVLKAPPHHHMEEIAKQKLAGKRASRIFILLLNKKLHIFLLVLFVSLLIKIRQRFKVIQQENISNELSFLKAQVNPHFLFNTLNSIYALSLQKSDLAPDAVLKLSDMMRYMLKDSNEKVSLEDDLNYIRDYLALQKLRLSKNVELLATISQTEKAWKIEPLLLIPFIENAFKYGVSTDEETVIFIHIEVSESGLLHMIVKNTKRMNTHTETTTQLGLQNVKKRLHLIYPDSHELYVNDLEKEFGIDLNIQLHD